MNKLFSDSTPKSFKSEFAEKVLNTKEGDSCEYCEGAEDLRFSLEGDEVLVEDRANDEMTKVSFSDENPTEFQLEAYEEDPEEEVMVNAEELPSEEEEVKEEVHTESDNLQSVEVEVLPGPDGEEAKDLIEDLRIEITEGIDDKEKSGTRVYSMVFKGVPHDKAKKIAKAFSVITSPLDALVESAEVDEEVEVSVNEEDGVKVMSFSKVKTFSEEAPEEKEEMTADALMEKANQLAAEVADGVNKENAEAVKAKAEEILVEAEKLESNGSNCSFLKLMCNQYCDAATKAMSDSEEETPVEVEEKEKEQYEEGFEAGEQYEEGKEAEKVDEGEGDDPESEEQKEFSETDPKVTVTVTNIEPASLSKLLGATEEPKEEEEKAPEFSEPKVDPNFEGDRHFSTTSQSTGVSFLLRSEIN